MYKTNKFINLSRMLLAIMAITLASSFLSSCGDDEDMLDVGYYLLVNSEDAYKGSSTDQQQGTIGESTSSVIYTTITLMNQAISETYPVRDRNGNDAAVIAGCDNVYRSYVESHTTKGGATVCVIVLYRARMEGTIVKSSTPLKTYHLSSALVNDQIDSPNDSN